MQNCLYYARLFQLFLTPWTLQSIEISKPKNTAVGSLSLLQGSNPGLTHCKQILYQLNHKGSLRMLKWIAYPFASRFPTEESKWGLLHCRWILYQLSYQGSPIQSNNSLSDSYGIFIIINYYTFFTVNIQKLIAQINHRSWV